jgi:chromosomal replication initiator protein
MTDASLPLIGDQFGGRDHTTVIHSVEKITREMEEQAELYTSVKDICKKIDPDFAE